MQRSLFRFPIFFLAIWTILSGCNFNNRTDNRDEPKAQDIPRDRSFKTQNVDPAPNATGSNWLTARGDSANTYFAPVTLTGDLTLRLNPVVNGYIPIAVNSGILYALDKRDNRHLFAVNLSDNTVRWEFRTQGNPEPINEIGVQDKQIYVLSSNSLYALSETDGAPTVNWTYNAGGSRLVFGGNRVYYFAGLNKTITALDSATGEQKWLYAFDPLEAAPGTFALGGERLYFTLKSNRGMGQKLYALDTSGSTVQWTASIVDTWGVPVYKDGKVYVDQYGSDTHGKMHYWIEAFDAVSGKSLWKYDTISQINRLPSQGMMTVNNQAVFTINSEGYLMAIHKDTGAQLWKILYYDSTARSNGSLISTNDQLLMENNGKIKIFDAYNGSKIKETLLVDKNYRPLAIAAGQLFLTDGTSLIAYDAAQAETAPPKPDIQSPIVHVVVSGDTLWKIAQKYKTTIQEIAALNSIDPNQYLYIGQRLTMPANATTPAPPQPAPANQVTYVVQAGDTLWKIAQKYGTTVQSIIALNNIDPNKYLYVGQKLLIPAASSQPNQTVHIVQSGDTLWKISVKYGISISAIVIANNLDPSKYLYVGQKLIIPG